MKCLMYEEEMWPVYIVRPKEQALDGENIINIPKGLALDYKVAENLWLDVQKELRKYWEKE